jgi:hypothetical protein
VDNPCAATDLSIRVVLAGLPPMVAALVRDAVRGEGIHIVDEVEHRADLSDIITRGDVQVVIVPTDASGVARHYHDLLRRSPDLKVLTIATMARGADLYEVRLLGTNVGRRDVVAAIRAVVGGDDLTPDESSHQ